MKKYAKELSVRNW